MKSLQVAVGKSKLASIDAMNKKQEVLFSCLGKSLDAHKYGDVVSLGKLLTTYINDSTKIGKLNLSNFCTVKDVQDIINYIYNVQTVGLDKQLVPVIIGQVDGINVSAIQIKFEKKENVLVEKAKTPKEKKLLTADAIAQRVATLCNDNNVCLKEVFDLLKEEDATEVSEKIA